MRLSNTSSTYSRSMSTVCRDSRSVNELSAYEFSTYGTRCGGSVLASSHLDALPLLIFFIALHSLQLQSFIQADYMQTIVVPLIDQIVLCTHLIRKGILRIWRSHPVRGLVSTVRRALMR